MKLVAALLPLAFGPLVCGCAAGGAANQNCIELPLMQPLTATADHLAAPPGNSVTFDVGFTSSQPGCAVPEVVYLPTMTTSDTVNVTLPSPGVATCIGTTTVPATLTDTRSGAKAQLTCK